MSGPDGNYGQPSRESGRPPSQPAGPYWTGAGSNGPAPGVSPGFGPSAVGWYPPATGWDPAAAQRDTGPAPRVGTFSENAAAPARGLVGINPAKLLGVVVAILGSLNFVWGFLPELTSPRSDQTLSVFAVGPAYVPVLLLIAGLLALAAFLPGSEVSRLAVAAVSVGGAAGAIVSLGTAGAVELSTTSQINKGMGAVLLVIFGIIQAVVAIGAYVVGAGIAVPRAAGSGSVADVMAPQPGPVAADGYSQRAEPGMTVPGWDRSGPLPVPPVAAGGWAAAPTAYPADGGYPSAVAQPGYRQAAGYPSAGGYAAAGYPPAGGYPGSGSSTGAQGRADAGGGSPAAADPQAGLYGSAGWGPRPPGPGSVGAASNVPARENVPAQEPVTGPQPIVGLESRAARSETAPAQSVTPAGTLPDPALLDSALPDPAGTDNSPDAAAPADGPPTGTAPAEAAAGLPITGAGPGAEQAGKPPGDLGTTASR